MWMCERTQRVSTIATIFVSLLLFVGCGRRPEGSGNNSAVVDNVVLITIDTLRADHLGCYGYHPIQTPHLDDLAARGTRFAEAVTPVPLTLPSHASILTGTYPFLHGVRDMGGFVLGESPPTLATLLSQAGFRTAAFVGSLTLDHRYGVNRGFDIYDDQMPSAETSTETPKPERRAEAVVDRTLAWLAARPPGRFFSGSTYLIRTVLTIRPRLTVFNMPAAPTTAKSLIPTLRLAACWRRYVT